MATRSTPCSRNRVAVECWRNGAAEDDAGLLGAHVAGVISRETMRRGRRSMAELESATGIR